MTYILDKEPRERRAGARRLGPPARPVARRPEAPRRASRRRAADAGLPPALGGRAARRLAEPDLLPAAQPGPRGARRHDRLRAALPAHRHQPAARRDRLRPCGRRRHPARLPDGALQRLRAGDRPPGADAAQHLAVRAAAGLHPDPRHRRGLEDRDHLLRRGLLPADQHHRRASRASIRCCSRRRARWAPRTSTCSAR